MITAALNEGSRRVLRLRKLIVLYYAANFVTAVIAVAPAIGLIRGRLAHSLESDRLFLNFDGAWMIETLTRFHWWPVSGVVTTFAGLAGVYLVLSAFLAGGAIALLNREDEPFFSCCARYCGRLLRLLCISLLFYALVLLFNGGINVAIAFGREASMQAHTWTILHWIQIAVVLFLFGVVNMLFDYAKIVCIAGDQHSAIRATTGAFRFVYSHLGGTLAVYWICTAIGLLFLLGYHGLSEASGQQSWLAVVLVFVLRQFYMLIRMWLRLWTWSSELQLYTFSSTIVAPEPPSLAVAG